MQSSHERLAATGSPTIRDLEWAAGFLEGEGSFAYMKGGTQRVRASQVNSEPLARLKKIFGGSISYEPSRTQKETGNKKADCFAWAISGARARGVMLTLFPLLSEKRQDQITAAMKGERGVMKGEPYATI